MNTARPHDVFTRPNWMHSWVLEATFADKTLATTYVWNLADESLWDYQIRRTPVTHTMFGIRLLLIVVAVFVVAVVIVLIGGV